jgi:iron complex transport system substrate-binding protein
MNIVSLLPAATEIVCALGLRNHLIGRSHECDYPEDVAGLPPLTRSRLDSSLPGEEIDREVRRIVSEGLPIYALDEEQLARLQPDVVVTQAACEVCAISYDQVLGCVSRSAPGAHVVSLQPTRLADVWRDIHTVAEACEVKKRGEAIIAEIDERLDRLKRPSDRPRVTVIEWLSPPMLAGHWVPDVVEAAGGDYVGPLPGTLSPYVSWDEVRALRPDAVIVAPCGFDLERTTAEAEPLTAMLRTLSPRVLLMDGNAYLNRPGPRLLEAIEAIATWLYCAPANEPALWAELS